jgi:putative phage-type endonuclease
MNYSVKKFIKKNCSDTYCLDELNVLAGQVSKDSAGRYTDNSALKILCRYACVRDNKIIFNVDSRDSDQSLEMLKLKLDPGPGGHDVLGPGSQEHHGSRALIVGHKNTPSPCPGEPIPCPGEPIPCPGEPILCPVALTSEKIVTKKIENNGMPGKKRGFGNMSMVKQIVEPCPDNDSPDSKLNKSKVIKKSKTRDPDPGMPGNGSGSSGNSGMANNQKPTDQKPTDQKPTDQKPTDQKSTKKPVAAPARRSNKLTPVPEQPRNVNLFNSFNPGNKNINISIQPDALDPGTDKIVTKKGGFGVIKKSAYHETMDHDNKPPNHKTQDNVNDGYAYPVEKKFTGPIRDDSKYGPYGTDRYHDPANCNCSDKLTSTEKTRAITFRKLAAQYYPAQGSPDWFDARDKMATASDGGTIVGLNPYEDYFGFVSKKAHGKPFDTNIDCYHGKKYEGVATMVYEYRMNVKVKEFGLCQHPKYKFLGASPDGIVSEYKLKTKDGRLWSEIEKESERIENLDDRRKFIAKSGYWTKYVGRMLEIKCPRLRKILMDPDAVEVYGPHSEPITDLKKDVKKGVCPAYYWVQVQLQLQCCELDECDFWQCEVDEYTDKEDFLQDTDPNHPWLSRQTGHEKGAVIQLLAYEQLNNESIPYMKRIYNFSKFIHQPRTDMTPFEIDQWILDTLVGLPATATHKGMMFERVIYWKLIKTRNITILRDDKWFDDNIGKFCKAWDYVEYFRANQNKSVLFKKYIDMHPVDDYGRVVEKTKGNITKIMDKIFAEPAKDAPDKEHRQYAKFITLLDSEINTRANPNPDPDLNFAET